MNEYIDNVLIIGGRHDGKRTRIRKHQQILTLPFWNRINTPLLVIPDDTSIIDSTTYFERCDYIITPFHGMRENFYIAHPENQSIDKTIELLFQGYKNKSEAEM